MCEEYRGMDDSIGIIYVKIPEGNLGMQEDVSALVFTSANQHGELLQ